MANLEILSHSKYISQNKFFSKSFWNCWFHKILVSVKSKFLYFLNHALKLFRSEPTSPIRPLFEAILNMYFNWFLLDAPWGTVLQAPKNHIHFSFSVFLELSCFLQKSGKFRLFAELWVISKQMCKSYTDSV